MRERAQQEYKLTLERNVPMRTRDGVTLVADIVRPDAPGRFPVLLSRTPYGKDARSQDPNGSNWFFARCGYIAVTQDCRGRFNSEGDYTPLFQEVTDGHDAVEWAARLPWSNGRVATFGQSYLGATQYLIACNNPMPSSLQAMAPISASADFHQSWVYHTGGAMMWGWMVPYAIHKGRNTLERKGLAALLKKIDEYVEQADNFAMPLTQEWFRRLPINDWVNLLKETAPYFADYISHPDDGQFWWSINLTRHAASVRVPMLHVSSWYDIFLEGALNAYPSIKEQSLVPQARGGQRLILGPWAHLFPYVQPTSGGTGDIDFGPDALVDLHHTHLRWYDYWLKDVDTGIMSEPPVSVFAMGENRWKSFSDWPPPSAHYVRFFFHSGGKANALHGDGSLSTVPPGEEPPDTFTYDPNDPVPTLGGNNLAIPLGVRDQRPVEQRNDVLVFTSDPLERPIEVTGPITVELWAASTARDTDFTAKLVDVHPDGYAQNLQDGIIRARYRECASSPTFIEPGQVYRYTIDLWATSNVFLPGHRLRVEISSSNFPRFDRNPNTGAAFGSDTVLEKAEQSIYHRNDLASHSALPVIPR